MQKSTYRNVVIIYAALITGLVLFCFVTYLAGSIDEQQTYQMDMMGYIAIALSVTGSAAGFFIYNAQLQTAASSDAAAKLATWRTATIIRAACTEAPCLFCVINIMLTGGNIFLILYAALLGWMLYNFPTPNKVISELQITMQELQTL